MKKALIQPPVETMMILELLLPLNSPLNKTKINNQLSDFKIESKLLNHHQVEINGII
jgi:hypothetical protein